MSPTRISIDLCQFPLQIGGLLLSKYIVCKGSKGVKLNGRVSPSREEVVESLEDAHRKVKSFFGSPNFDAAVVVVPNSVGHEIRKQISFNGKAAGFNITQVVDEHTAVAVGYANKVLPTERTKLAIISHSGGVLEVSIVSVIPSKAETGNYYYILHERKSHSEPIDFENHKNKSHSGGGAFGFVEGVVEGVVNTLVVDPFEAVTGLLKNLFRNVSNDDKDRVDKVVLVGKAASSQKLQHEAMETFHGAQVWPGLEEAGEVAAYGAAVMSFTDIRVRMKSPGEYGTGDAGFEA